MTPMDVAYTPADYFPVWALIVIVLVAVVIVATAVVLIVRAVRRQPVAESPAMPPTATP